MRTKTKFIAILSTILIASCTTVSDGVVDLEPSNFVISNQEITATSTTLDTTVIDSLVYYTYSLVNKDSGQIAFSDTIQYKLMINDTVYNGIIIGGLKKQGIGKVYGHVKLRDKDTGSISIKLEVNPNKHFSESNYSNNTTSALTRLVKKSSMIKE